MRNYRFFFAAALPILLVLYLCIQLFVPARVITTPIDVEIPEGANFKQAIFIFSRSNLIRDRGIFTVMGRVMGLDKKIRAGFYRFTGTVTPWDAFIALKEGKIVESQVTIVEGDSLREIAPKLAEKGLMQEETLFALADNREFLRSLSIDAPSIEGYLYPQTYRFPKGVSPLFVLKSMVMQLRGQFDEDMKGKMKALKWSENEILTLASIIEKEAVIDRERPVIAAVYHNRLRKGMPLQADPTAIYGVKSSRERITRKDLQMETSFNTYVIRGLPPGPIASPGKKSILAAIYPADVPFLYFVSRGDGSHQFSVTLPEHNRAVARYRGR